MSDHDDLQPHTPDTPHTPDIPVDPATEAALAELDRLGRHAGLALRSAAAALAPPAPTPTLPPPGPTFDAADVATTNGDGVMPVVVELREPREQDQRGPARRRLVLLAAAIAGVAGLAATRSWRTSSEPVQMTPGVEGAPTAVLGDEGGGIWPPEVTDRNLMVASPEHTEVWDQWTLVVQDAGEHLLLSLGSGDTSVVEVLPDLGSAPLQAGAVDSDDHLPGTDETAVFGVVRLGSSRVTVERPGAAPVEVHVEPVAGASHHAFVGFVPGDLGPDAEVVAYGDTGTELDRAPIGEVGDEDPADGLFPDDAQHPPLPFGPDEPDDAGWNGEVTTGGHYVVIGAWGHEDSASTVIERPGTQPLQVLATHLNGEAPGSIAVYGLVTVDAASVELEVPGADPLALDLAPIDGATHQTFGGWPAAEGPAELDGAVVVARDAGGAVIDRRPLEWTRYDAAG